MSDNWCREVDNGAVLLTVNQRLSRYYVRQHSDVSLTAGKQWWETPDILPIGAWLKRMHSACVSMGLSEKTLLADIAAERVWRSVIDADAGTGTLLDPDLAARGAQQAWSVANHWQCFGIGCEEGATGSVDQHAFARWQEDYKTYLQENQFVDSAGIASEVAELLATSAEKMVLPHKVYLAGFLVMPVQLQQTLDVLKKAGVEIETLQQSLTANVTRVAHVDDAAGLLSIAEKTKVALEENPQIQIGVVVADLQQRRAEVLRAFDSTYFPGKSPDEIAKIGRPYDLSIGWPLVEQPVVRTALLFLKLLERGVNDVELSVLLLSPYLEGTDRARRGRERLDRQLRELRQRHVSFDGFLEVLADDTSLQSKLKKIARRKWGKKCGAAAWAERFGKILNELGWPGNLDSSEYQAVEAWQKCLGDFQVLDNGELLGQAEALRTLTRLCTQHVFQIQTPAASVQIMGRLESHGLSFDTLWITGLDSDSWPPVTSPTPFIPIKQQQGAGVPEASAELRLKFASDEFAQWKHSATDLFVTHASSRDSMELKPASIIAHYPEAEALTKQPSICDLYAHVQSSDELTSHIDTHGTALEAGSTVKGGARLLENQALCPFKAYASHRLRIKPLEEAGIGLDPRQLGTVLHRVMELFWIEVKTHAALVALSDEDRNALYLRIIAESLDGLKASTAEHDLLATHLYRLLSEWVERCEIPRQPFEVIHTEADREVEIAGVKMNLKVDRIDRLDSGQSIVVDYKTGANNKIQSWADDRIESPQLPLYAGTDSDVQGIVIAQVFAHKYKYIGITSENDLVMSVKSPGSAREPISNLGDWEGAGEHWAQSLENVATEILQGVATVTPAKNACEYCDLKPVCRIELNTLSGEEEQLDADAGGEA